MATEQTHVTTETIDTTDAANAASGASSGAVAAALALVDNYIAAWNETDAERRLALIARTWTENATYVDPLMRGEGHAGIAAMIQGVQTQFPGFTFRRTSDVDAHNDRVRFAWALGPDGGAALAGGVDFGSVENGRLRAITGFLDFAPKQA